MEENNPIKICYVVSSSLTLKFILFNQLKFIQGLSFEVSAVCSEGKWVKEIEKQGIKVKIINFNRDFNVFVHIICFFKLLSYFKKEKFDIICTHTPVPGLLGQIAARAAGIPIVVNTIHGFYFQNKDKWLKRKLFILAEKIAAKCSDLIFFVNREDIKTAKKEKICRPEIIRYFGGGIDCQRFDPNRFSKEFISVKKNALGVGNKKVVGIVARLVKEKGYMDLFLAFKKVLAKFPDTVLLMAGPKEPKKKDAVKLSTIKDHGLEDKVIFLGGRTDVDEIYLLMDVFVLPSYREGLGISLLEASAMEKPVVACNIRGCREAVEDGKTGLLVPLKNPQKLAETIIYLLENPKIAQEMGQRGRVKVLKEFNEQLVFGRIKKEYERLIREKL